MNLLDLGKLFQKESLDAIKDRNVELRSLNFHLLIVSVRVLVLGQSVGNQSHFSSHFLHKAHNNIVLWLVGGAHDGLGELENAGKRSFHEA
jgi:hypothetical protein